MKLYSFVVDIEIEDAGLTSEELDAIKRYVATRPAIRKAIEARALSDDPAFNGIYPPARVKVKVS